MPSLPYCALSTRSPGDAMGLKIITYRITVEQDDIELSTGPGYGVEWSKTCPIALAAARVTGRVVESLSEYLLVHSWAGAERFLLPQIAQRFVKRFDNRQSVKPIAFYVSRRESTP